MNRIIITGGAGFIGSALTRFIIQNTQDVACVIDKLTYAGNLENLAPIARSPRFRFEKADVSDRAAMNAILADVAPTHIIHLAAESHVDRSIDAPDDFMQTNIIGTYTLLEATRQYIRSLPKTHAANVRFHHVSTDEVFGDLKGHDDIFRENTPYAPSSPYSASKAASDHLVRAWHRTFGIPVIISNCSNNYGPCQFPEKLIPLIILRALEGQTLPIYGEGLQIRDWLYVDDHARALYIAATKGTPGETYLIGGHNEKTNIQVVTAICRILDELAPKKDGTPYETQITHVKDRPGHDARYAIDPSKITSELGWTPQETFESGLVKTVRWYLEQRNGWCARVLDGSYKMERLGQTDHS